MNDKWKALFDWEDKHKAVSFMTISLHDVREYGKEWADGERAAQIDNLTDEDLYNAMQNVARKYDFGDIYGDIYEWILEKAQAFKDNERG